MTGRQGRIRKQLLDDFKEMRKYCKLLREEVLDRNVWEIGFGTCRKIGKVHPLQPYVA